ELLVVLRSLRRAGGRALVGLLELLPELWQQHLEARRHGPARGERLEHRQRRGERHVMGDERRHELPERIAVLIERDDALLPRGLTGTDVGLLVRDEVRRREEAVLQVVDIEI